MYLTFGLRIGSKLFKLAFLNLVKHLLDRALSNKAEQWCYIGTTSFSHALDSQIELLELEFVLPAHPKKTTWELIAGHGGGQRCF